MSIVKPGLWRRFTLALGAFFSVLRYGVVDPEALWARPYLSRKYREWVASIPIEVEESPPSEMQVEPGRRTRLRERSRVVKRHKLRLERRRTD